MKFKSRQGGTLEFRDAHLVKATWKNRDMVTPKIRGVITTGVVIKR